MMSDYLLLLIVFSPAVGMLVLLFTPKESERNIRIIGLLAPIIPLLLILFMYMAERAGTALASFTVVEKWFNLGHFVEDPDLFSVYFIMSVDGLALVMLLLTAFISCMAAVASLNVRHAGKSYFMLFQLLQIGMLGVFVAGDFLLFFLFFELTLVSMFFLIGKWGLAGSEKAAYSFLIYNGIGSAILLIVIMVLFSKTGTSSISVLQQILPDGGITYFSDISPALKTGLALALLVAFGIKLPIFPFHTWMLQVHSKASPAIVMLHAGVLLKIGAYGIIRFCMGIFPDEFKDMSALIIVIGIIGLLYGAFLALVQKDIKMVLAYSSVSHMGIVLIGLGTGNEAGIQGAVFQVVSHGLIAALLFFLVGLIYDREQSSQLSDLKGAGRSMPFAGGFLLAGGMAALGLPGLSGFISELLVFMGLFQEDPVLGAVAALGLVLTAAYILRAVLTIVSSGHAGRKAGRDVNGIEWLPLIALLLAIAAIGLYPAVLEGPLSESLKVISIGLGGGGA